MSSIFLALLFFLLLIVFPTSALAQYVQYGGVTTSQAPRQALIEKKILNPANSQFVDNLTFEQHTFLPGQDVIFRVTVTNVIQTDLKNLQIFDKLPDTINFVSTSFGNFDPKTNSISFTIDTLKVGESKTFEIKAKVKSANEIPTNVTCKNNLSRVTVDNMVDEDTTSFCVSRQVLGATSALPTTGPAQTGQIIMLSTLLLIISFLIRRIIFLESRS